MAPFPSVRQPQRTRGFVTTYAAGRTCAEPECLTVLSRYNQAERCWRHGDERGKRDRG